ncbi:hypothetical protein ETD86_37495 [Nonomuraea turkmeniaca]|uniref:Uncharacterized protein n=1 Tax=Nonomuraea turkmeniaca TaxID=103838 RepID=A0A5S4F468_9ACTN|nr:hypothetical protein [Nonomuraea turkmeniaca]TMR10951.1 hypothetical protein ETD86_37495 [Nonomuraea turkmeniaca]
MPEMDIAKIVAVVKQGKTVVSGEDSMIVDAVLRATEENRKATFYVPRALHEEVMARYWTSERLKQTGTEPVSDEEARRIKAELDLDINGYSNRIDCPRCGHVYDMYEFLKQGIAEHGREIVEGILALEDAAVIRVNPVQSLVCPNCKLLMRGHPHYYGHCQYACCRGGQV